MRVVVQIVIVSTEIDIAPALNRPVEFIVDAGPRRIIEDRPVAALMQPLDGGVLARKEVVLLRLGRGGVRVPGTLEPIPSLGVGVP